MSDCDHPDDALQVALPARLGDGDFALLCHACGSLVDSGVAPVEIVNDIDELPDTVATRLRTLQYEYEERFVTVGFVTYMCPECGVACEHRVEYDQGRETGGEECSNCGDTRELVRGRDDDVLQAAAE